MNIAEILYRNYEKYQENRFVHRRFKHHEFEKLLQEKHKNLDLFKAGESIEGRNIYTLKAGKGDTSVFLWSQMHGDEATATLALLDIFNFLQADDELASIRKTILSKLQLTFMPMVNPDGTERFMRRNAIHVDINRDCKRLQTPEGKLLWDTAQKLKPLFGFNLHDQSPYYSAGYTANPAALAFLAPAYNVERNINPVRKRAMRLIAMMNAHLQSFIPKQIARYSDEYEPRAFGDNLQGSGISTILVEAGAIHQDREKQVIRKLNFVAILVALMGIADGSFEKYNLEEYDTIPLNAKERFFDLMLRNCTIQLENHTLKVDIGINFIEKNNADATDFTLEAQIVEVGDLSGFYGYQDYNMRNARIEATNSISIGTKPIFKIFGGKDLLFEINGSTFDYKVEMPKI